MISVLLRVSSCVGHLKAILHEWTILLCDIITFVITDGVYRSKHVVPSSFVIVTVFRQIMIR
jgi:hypothetical protein